MLNSPHPQPLSPPASTPRRGAKRQLFGGESALKTVPTVYLVLPHLLLIEKLERAASMNTVTINNRYRLEERLGRGGMGEVYRAYDRLTGNYVALKRVLTPTNRLIFGSMSAHGDFKLALAREFRTLASLRHPHIISVLDYGFERVVNPDSTADSYPYYTMELLTDPQPLVVYGQGQPLGFRLELVIQMLYALVYLHRRGIIHRDLKPDNVIVMKDQVKLLDFGLAAAQDYLEERHQEIMAGTLSYMAPEVLIGMGASEMSDLYAVGLMVYELVADHHPFGTTDVTGLMHDILYTVPDVESLNIPDRLKMVLQKLLTKQPVERYTSAQEVIRALTETAEIPTQPENASMRESFLQAARFVGREPEVEQLSIALQHATDGAGSVWLVGGESGVGKSRLLDELRVMALVEGVLVLQGQAIFEGGAPYRLWREVLRRLALQTDLSDLEASVIKALVPDIGDLLERDVADAPDLEPEAARQRIVNVIEDVFRRQTQPVLVLLEDLQWASESLIVLARMIRIAGNLPLLIVANYRDDERPSLPQELPDIQMLKLERLTPEAIAELSVSMLGDAGRDKKVVNLLERETEGNVFFIVEAVRVLAEEAGELSEIKNMILPEKIFAEGMMAFVQRRLSRLPSHAHALLQAAAVGGRELDLQVLRIISTNYLSAADSTIELDSWLSACTDATVLEVQDNRWRFAHDKLREALLNDLTDEQKRALHRWLALTIEQVHPDDPAQTVVLAYHWTEAEDPVQEARYTALAGQQSLANGAHSEAISFLERAIALASSTGMDMTLQAQLEQQLGEAYYGIGRLPETELHLKQSLALIGYPYPISPGGLRLEILREVARQGWHRVRIDLLRRPFQSGDDTMRFVIAARASEGLGRILFLQNKKTDMMYSGMQAVNRAEQAGAEGRSEQIRNYAGIALGIGTIPLHRLTRTYTRRVTRAMEDTTDDAARGWAYQTTGLYAGGRGQWEEAEFRLTRAVDLAERLGNWRRWQESSGLLSTIYTLMGRWDNAWLITERLREQAQRHDDVQGEAAPQLAQARLALRRARFEDGLSLIERALPNFEKVNDRVQMTNGSGLAAAIHAHMGDWERGKQYADRALHLMAQTSPTAFYSFEGYAGTAEFYLALWEARADFQYRAATLEALGYLHQFARIFDVAHSRWLIFQGWYAWLDGNRKGAWQNGEQAVLEALHLHMPYDEALARYHFARFLPKDDMRRPEHLMRAAELFDHLGARWDLERTRKEM
jgi:Protein kinase domain/AAA ATPase domain